MFYVVSKILGIVISPILWVFLFIIISFYSKKKKQFLFLALFVLYFFTSPILFNISSNFVEKKQSNVLETGHYDYGIVLGGIASLEENGKTIRFSNNITRLIAAIELYKLGKISKILISAGNIDTSNIANIEAVFLREYLITNGVPKNRILIEYKSINTRQNALFSAQILKPKKNKFTYLLITSSYHLTRAKACFKKVGFKIDGFSTGQLGENSKLTIIQFIPSGSILYKWHYILHELVGQFAYKLMGYS